MAISGLGRVVVVVGTLKNTDAWALLLEAVMSCSLAEGFFMNFSLRTATVD